MNHKDTIRQIIKEEVRKMKHLFEAGPSRKFAKAAEKLYDEQLKQQQLQKAFVKEKDPKKKEKMKAALIAQHKIVQKVQSAFNAALNQEPIDLEMEIAEAFQKGDKVKYNDMPGVITHVEDRMGKTYYSVKYKSPSGTKKARMILSTDGTITEDTTAKSKPTYFKGLSKDDKKERERVIKRRSKMDDDDPDAYKKFRSDAGAKTKPSQHTKKYKQMFGEVSSAVEKALKKKAEKTGMPYGVLKQVFNRGMAAWKTGHKPGASQQQWGYARVNSFVTKSKGTWGGADKDLAKKVRGKKK